MQRIIISSSTRNHFRSLNKLCSIPSRQYSSSNVTKTDISLIDSGYSQQQTAFILNNVLTQEECKHVITLSEKMGFEDAPVVNTMNKNVRNNDRIIMKDTALAQDLFNRIQPYLPSQLLHRSVHYYLYELNDQFRVYRYYSGQKFKPHADGSIELTDPIMKKSFLTVLFYLNDDVKHGSTRILDRKVVASSEGVKYRELFEVKPETGSVLVFSHNIFHEGEEVESGVKYVLRSDVFYTPLSY
jgi:prolyl 4-hydroxylase